MSYWVGIEEPGASAAREVSIGIWGKADRRTDRYGGSYALYAIWWEGKTV
jgi:hypothetical protein